MMFEVGRSYRITTGIGEDEGYSFYTIVEVEMPLIKVEQPGRTIVLNTSSPAFVRAELHDPEALAAAREAWIDSLQEEDDRSP